MSACRKRGDGNPSEHKARATFAIQNATINDHPGHVRPLSKPAADPRTESTTRPPACGGAARGLSGGYAMRVATSLRLATSLLVAASGAAIAQDPIPDGDWRTINRDLASTRFSPLAEIDRSNVARLTEAWSYPFRSFTTAVPIVIDGTMYIPAGSRIVALDADSGQEKWVYTIPA